MDPIVGVETEQGECPGAEGPAVPSPLPLVCRSAGSLVVQPNEPLHKRAPLYDEHGRLLNDFMLLVPGMRQRPQHQVREILALLQGALSQFAEVVFAEMILPLNLLMVWVKPRSGVMFDIATAVQARVPEARLVLAH